MSDPTPERVVPLGLGSNVIQLLLPHRWPMLMVDRLERFTGGATPQLEASRHVGVGDIFLQGHFPDLHLWPGCLMIEGMGQTCAALAALLAIRDRLTTLDDATASAFEALRNLERRFRLHAGYSAENEAGFRAAMIGMGHELSVGAAVDVRLRQPVFAGSRLDYRVQLTHAVGSTMRFAVEASVGGDIVAEGTMTGVRVPQMGLAQPGTSNPGR